MANPMSLKHKKPITYGKPVTRHALSTHSSPSKITTESKCSGISPVAYAPPSVSQTVSSASVYEILSSDEEGIATIPSKPYTKVRTAYSTSNRHKETSASATRTPPSASSSLGKRKRHSSPIKNQLPRTPDDTYDTPPSHELDTAKLRSSEGKFAQADTSMRSSSARATKDNDTIRPRRRPGQSARVHVEDSLATTLVNHDSPPTTPPSMATTSPSTTLELLTNSKPAYATDRPGVDRLVITPKQKQLWSGLLGDTQPDLPKLPVEAFPRRQVITIPGSPPVELQRSRSRLIDSLQPSGSDPVEVSSEMDVSIDSSSPPAAEVQRRPSTLRKEVSSISQGAMYQAESSLGSQRSHGPENSQHITYARERSYLVEPADSMETLLSQPLASPEQKRGWPGPQPAKDGDLQEESEFNTMRSIHDLRASGDSRRFTDEMEVMMEDIEHPNSASLARRRNGMIELARRLVNDDFRSRFTHSGYKYRVLSGCRDVQDPIVGYALAAAISIILAFLPQVQTSIDVEILTLKSLTNMLDHVKDIEVISRERKMNMSKSAQILLTDFKTVVRSLPLWAGNVPMFMSPCLLGLRALDELVQSSRAISTSQAVADEGLVSTIVVKIINIIEHHLKLLPSAPKQYVQSYGLELEFALSIMESYTLSPAFCADASLWTEKLLRQLVTSIDTVLAMHIELGSRTKFLCLRLCLNLANNNERNSDAFNVPSLIASLMELISTGLDTSTPQLELDDGVQKLDMTILALGTMINLVEWSVNVRKTVLDSTSKQLDALVQAFVKNRELVYEVDSLKESHTNVLHGYLAVLLGNLCHEPALRKHVIARLPKERLGMVIEAVEEFIEHHKTADSQEEAQDVWVAFTARLQTVAEGLKHLTSE